MSRASYNKTKNGMTDKNISNIFKAFLDNILFNKKYKAMHQIKKTIQL